MARAKLRTRSLFQFWTRGIAEEMRVLQRDFYLVFFHRLLVQPQETSVVHMGE